MLQSERGGLFRILPNDCTCYIGINHSFDIGTSVHIDTDDVYQSTASFRSNSWMEIRDHWILPSNRESQKGKVSINSICYVITPFPETLQGGNFGT